MTTPTADKTALQIFLEEVRRIVGVGQFNFAAPSEIHAMLALWQQGVSPEKAAAQFKANRVAQSSLDHDAYLADVKDGLANQAYSVEQEVLKLSNNITESIKENGPVKGLLYYSHSAQDLPRLGAKLKVFKEYLSLVQTICNSIGSAKLAVETARAGAVLQLADLRDLPDSKEHLGASEALKLVIKILDNSL